MNYGRKNKISHKILEYITQNDYLAIDGFIHFCLQEYLAEIKFAVDLACEELKNEKEYNEFVKLLRYFVDTQPPMVTEVNIMMNNGGRFTLWDGNGTRIEERHLDYYWEDMARGDIDLDDVLISILITVAPRRIVLHNTGKEPKNESVKMIRKVFGQRITECQGCERCFSLSQPKEIVTLKVDK
jgi:putative sporulation protein YtxC